VKPLSRLEAATIYLHAVDGESVKQIAIRQGCDTRSVRRTIKSACQKLDAETVAQAAIRAYTSGELLTADRSYQRRATRAAAEEKLLRRERNKQRGMFKRRGLTYDQPTSDDDTPDDYGD
jgi:DNA-binding CsgD family transcriptional regulator